MGLWPMAPALPNPWDLARLRINKRNCDNKEAMPPL